MSTIHVSMLATAKIDLHKFLFSLRVEANHKPEEDHKKSHRVSTIIIIFHAHQNSRQIVRLFEVAMADLMIFQRQLEVDLYNYEISIVPSALQIHPPYESHLGYF